MDTSSLPATANPSGEPNIAALISEFKSCSPYTGSNWNRVRLNEDIRFTRWANQYPDGKKRNTSQGPAFPWPGASDARVPAADEIINWTVGECFVAFWRAWIAPKAGLTEVRNYAVKLVDYLVNTLLKEHLYDEVELASQYRETYGWTVLHPTWELELDLEYREVKMADLVQASQAAQQQFAQLPPGAPLDPILQQNAQMLASLPALVNDPSSEEQAVKALDMIYGHYAKMQMDIEADVQVPALRPDRLRQAVRDLRANGKAEMPMPYVCQNQPAIYALKPWDEVFLRGQATDVQKAIVFRRVWLTEVEVRAKIQSAGWDPEWVEAAVKLKGRISTWGSATSTTPPVDIGTAMATQDTASWNLYDQKTDLIEIIYATYRQLDQDGVPGVYLTVFHPDIGGAPEPGSKTPRPVLKSRATYAEHGLLGWGGGKLPYVAVVRERWNRPIATSRGTPEIVNSWQRIMKVHTDGAIDNMSISVLPPINIYENTLGVEYVLGPAIKNNVRQGKEPRFAEVPTHAVPLAGEMVEKTQRDIDRYAGRDNPLLPPGGGQSKRQMTVGKFLLGWANALQMTASLCQEFMSDAEFARITGAPPGWLDQNRKKRNLLAASLEFDIRELDGEFVAAQMQAINQLIIPGDVGGITDRNKLTQFQWRTVNPMLARELVRDQSDASQQLWDAVKTDIALMFIGQEARYVEMDPTAPTKLQYASQIVSANPNYVQALKDPKGRFAELMQKWDANLQFSLTEEQNKKVGAIGVQPAAAGGPGQ